MAAPSSGELSMQDIACEKVFDNYGHPTDGLGASQRAGIGAISLKDVSTSGNSNGSGTSFEATNTNNATSDRPDGSNPHAMSEFYSYDHDKSGSPSPTSGTLYYSSSCGPGGFDACLGTSGTYYWVGSGDPVVNAYAIYTNSSLTSTALAGCYSSTSGMYRLWVTTPSPSWQGQAASCPAF
jgi:hypothetical protein